MQGGGQEGSLGHADRAGGTEPGLVIDPRPAPIPTPRPTLCATTPQGTGLLGRRTARRDGLAGRSRLAPVRSAPLGVRSGRTPLTMRPPPRDSATTAWPTPAPPAGPPATDHAPAPGPDGPHLANLAPGALGRGLDRQPRLAAGFLEQLPHEEPVEPDQRGDAATVALHQGPPLDVAVERAHQ
jgi:hypothetical protein